MRINLKLTRQFSENWSKMAIWFFHIILLKALFLDHRYHQKAKMMFLLWEKGPTNYLAVDFCNRNRYAEANYKLIHTSFFNTLFCTLKRRHKRKTSRCLVGISVQRHNCVIFLRKWARRDRYSQWRSLSGHVLFTKIEEEDIGSICFQQDGATCHTAEATLDVLRPVFEDRIISHSADVVWPTRSCDLTPLDYYLWGAVKDKCYADKSETIDALKGNIREVIREIQLHIIDNVLKYGWDSVSYCMASRGIHLNDIIFHY